MRRDVNMKKPIVTLCITSYNRKNKLQACIESFFMTNLFDPQFLEVIIVDNGSDDLETKEFINSIDFSSHCRQFKKIINGKNDWPFCRHRAKNQARSIASGEYFIDCPDDHLFVVRSNWIEETINYLENSTDKTSCVCHYAYPKYRFSKPQNLMKPSISNSNYYVTHRKGYADYHLMKRATYEEIGPFNEMLAFTPNSEDDYMDRSFTLGYRRSLLKYPCSVVIDSETFPDFDGADQFARLVNPIEEKDYREFYSDISFPVSCESLLEYALKTGAIKILPGKAL